MDKIRCVVERITYQNEDNGYSVIKVRVKNIDELFGNKQENKEDLKEDLC